MPYGGLYSISSTAYTCTTANVLLQLKAGAAAPCQIKRVFVSAEGVTSSVMQGIGIYRYSVAATVTAAVLGTSIFDDQGGNVAASASLGTSATGIKGGTTGTAGDKIYTDDFNVLQGWEKIFTPSEYIIVPGGGIICVVLVGAPGSSTVFDATLTFSELG